MNILYALIAFSIVMIIMSTLVVALVNLLHEMRGVRQRHMRYMLGTVFDEYLWPEFGKLAASIDYKPRRAESERPAAHGELYPERDIWASIGAALDLWTIVVDWFETERQGPKRHGLKDWGEIKRSRLFVLLFFIVWAVILAVVLLCLSHDLLIALLAVGALVFFLIDRVREKDRENFAMWHGVNAGTAKKLAELDDLLALTARQAEAEAGDDARALSSAEAKRLEALLANPELQGAELRDIHQRLTRRRRFVDEILKASKSIATSKSRADKSKQSEISLIDFASHIGRTEFGEAIRRTAVTQKENALDAAAETLNKLIDDLGRRFDNAGKETTANFAEIARRWSIGLAFVVAIIANVDAVLLFRTFYEDPDLSQKVDAAYSARVEEFASREAKLVEAVAEQQAKVEAEEDSNAQQTAEEELADLKEELANFREDMSETLEELEELGVPVGWKLFPYCVGIEDSQIVSPKDVMELDDLNTAVKIQNPTADPRCVALAEAEVTARVARLRASAKAALVEAETANLVARNNPTRESANDLREKARALENEAIAEWNTIAVGYGDIREALSQSSDKCTLDPRVESTESAIHSAACSFSNWQSYFAAAQDWLAMRRDFGLSAWLFGVLLGGALVGLGGPFWFDLYKRLSALAQVARAAGFTAQVRAKPKPDQEAAPAPEDVHKPKNVRDAFNNALEVRQQVEQAADSAAGFETLAALTEGADESKEAPATGSRAPLPLNPDGSTA